jgi:hypothetical protein
MRLRVSALHLLAAIALWGQGDKFCFRDQCQFLTVRQGLVRFADFPALSRDLVIGRYAQGYQRFVPAVEVPIRGARSPGGWLVVVSAFLDHAEGGQELRVRMYAPDGSKQGQSDIMSALEGLELGDVFGTADEVLAITSTEEHAYNVNTTIWLLQKAGGPRKLMDVPGVLIKAAKARDGARSGALIRRQTYDGEHAETKGWVEEFWAWDPIQKSLIPPNE